MSYELSYIDINPDEVYFLEYSVSQSCFHVDTLSKIIEMNRGICETKRATGYIIIDGPFREYEDAMKAIHKFPKLEQEVKDNHDY